MDIYATRRTNLRWLIDTVYRGVTAELAKDLRIQPSQLSRVFSTNPKNQRNIGARLARSIEEVTRQPVGWMDQIHGSDQTETITRRREALVMLPGNKQIPIVDYEQARAWTAQGGPDLPRAEMIWTNLETVSDKSFAVRIEGESMVSEFYPGDIALFDPGLAPKPGDFVVAKLDKEDRVVFRKYRLKGADKKGHPIIELAPLNENYPLVMLDASNPGRIVATLVEHRKFRRTDRISSELAAAKGSTRQGKKA